MLENRRLALEESGKRSTKFVNGPLADSVGQLPTTLDMTTMQHLRDKWDTHWRGISGAPVFTDPGGVLAGIITKADRRSPNALFGLPLHRLLDDEGFRRAVAPWGLGDLPERPFCVVLTTEAGSDGLVDEVAGAMSGHREEFKELHEEELHEEPVELRVLDAISSPDDWATAVRALATADYLVADVTGFEPAVMLLLGVRAVLRRGVTISVRRGAAEAMAERGGPDSADESTIPFNVMETRVLTYPSGKFYGYLYQAMTDGAAALRDDRNYLDLPAYHGVRTPRLDQATSDGGDPKVKRKEPLLMLCPFNDTYAAFFDDWLSSIISGHTGGLTPQRMVDLRSPRLVGQALYERIRWSTRCLVDWTGWRANVLFEHGVRLACTRNDPVCIIDEKCVVDEAAATAADRTPLQKQKLEVLLRPVAYDTKDPRKGLKSALEAWRDRAVGSEWRAAQTGRLAAGKTFEIAQRSFVWSADPFLLPPHDEQRATIATVVHRDRERYPERMALFAGDPAFAAALQDVVRERWIAGWLYLRHLKGGADAEVDPELARYSEYAAAELELSENARHRRIYAEMSALADPERGVDHTGEDAT